MAGIFDDDLEESYIDPKTRRLSEFFKSNINSENISGLRFESEDNIKFTDNFVKHSGFRYGIYTGLISIWDNAKNERVGMLKFKLEEDKLKICTVQGVKGVITRIDWQMASVYLIIKLGLEYNLKYKQRLQISLEPDLDDLKSVIERIDSKKLDEKEVIKIMGINLEDAKILLANKEKMYKRIKDTFFNIEGKLDVYKPAVVKASRHATESVRLDSKLRRLSRINLLDSRVTPPSVYERVYKKVKDRILGNRARTFAVRSINER